MKHFIAVLLCFSPTAFAKDVPHLPHDPEIRGDCGDSIPIHLYHSQERQQ